MFPSTNIVILTIMIIHNDFENIDNNVLLLLHLLLLVMKTWGPATWGPAL